MPKRNYHSSLPRRSKGKYFVRRKALDEFEKHLLLPPEQRKHIWMLYGLGGMGKTELLIAMLDFCAARGHATAYIDRNIASDPLAVMREVSKQLMKQGITMTSFEKMYAKYKDLQIAIDTDPNRPAGLEIGMAATRIGTMLLPSPLDKVLSEVLHEDQSIRDLLAFLKRKFKKISSNDIDLIFDPIKNISPYFIQDLKNGSKKHEISLGFDDYEKVYDYLDQWLRDVLELHRMVDPKLMVLVAGKQMLGPNWSSTALRPELATHEIDIFESNELTHYLVEIRQVPNEAARIKLMELGKSVPLLTDLLVSYMPKDLAQLHAVTNEAIDCFLNWIEDENLREAILLCAVPRLFNLDVVRLLIGDKDSKSAFDKLVKLSFVTQLAQGGYAYHDVART